MAHSPIRFARHRGQGMTEYIVIVGLVAILLVGVVTRFKEQLRVTIEGSGTEVENRVNLRNAGAGAGGGGAGAGSAVASEFVASGGANDGRRLYESGGQYFLDAGMTQPYTGTKKRQP